MPDAAFKRFKLLPADGSAGSAKPEMADRLAPATPGPLPTLRATTSGGHREMAGSGFAITVPETWVVQLVEPEPDIHGAAPGDVWEALRAHQPGRRSACSVYVGIVPLDAGPIGESASFDTDEDATEPYWSGGSRPTLVVPPVRYRQRSGSSSEMVSAWPRPRTDDARLSHDVVYVVTCAADGDRAPRGIVDSFEILTHER